MKIFKKKGILSKAIERDAKNMKKILEDIKTNTYERFYLFYGEEKYMISQMKNQLKKALVSEDDTMNSFPTRRSSDLLKEKGLMR